MGIGVMVRVLIFNHSCIKLNINQIKSSNSVLTICSVGLEGLREPVEESSMGIVYHNQAKPSASPYYHLYGLIICDLTEGFIE